MPKALSILTKVMTDLPSYLHIVTSMNSFKRHFRPTYTMQFDSSLNCFYNLIFVKSDFSMHGHFLVIGTHTFFIVLYCIALNLHLLL